MTRIPANHADYSIALLPGDGIGPEVVEAARLAIAAAAASCDVLLAFETHAAGALQFLETGEAISERVMQAVGEADAVLLGAMGLPNVRMRDGTEVVPQIDIRERYDLFASLRPCRLLPGVPSRLKADAIDILVIRELTEGLFAGRHHPQVRADSVSDTMTITRKGSERLFELAFRQARIRRGLSGTPGRVTLLDKANVLPSNAFFRKLFDEVAARHSDVQAERLYIDAGSMMLVTQPERFDVIVTENVFGDIVSEIGAGIVGGLGFAPSADVGEGVGVFQPSHGSAPDIAGRGCANPVATLLSGAMLLRWLGEQRNDERCTQAAEALQLAVFAAVGSGHLTPDAGGTARTSDVTEAVLSAFQFQEMPA